MLQEQRPVQRGVQIRELLHVEGEQIRHECLSAWIDETQLGRPAS
jgi:hypothetical protein